MAITYSTTHQLTASQGAKIAIYGNAGTGKTMLAATAPKPYIIAAEPGLIVTKPGNIRRVYGDNIPGINYHEMMVAKIENCKDLRAIHACFERRDPWTLEYQTIFMDSVSQMAEYELAYQMTQTPNGQKAYGQMADEILECIRLFTNLHEMNVVFVAKQGVSAHSGLFSASFPGQLMDFNFPYELDAILQYVISETTPGVTNRWLRTTSDFKNFAKDRTGALNPHGETPYLYNIFAKISAA